jgi:radical SAM superfamily enzyme YgiQ (UPF0313 family)
MKIVLISTDEGTVATGVKTLSSCLIEQGFETVVVLLATTQKSFLKFHWQDLDRICDGAGLIVISFMTHGLQKAIEVKRHLANKFMIPLIAGGMHACISAESLLDDFDMVCHGEGEDLIVELATRLNNNSPYYDIPGLWIKYKGKVIKNQAVSLKRNLDEYPFPDYDYNHQYVLKNNRLILLKPDSDSVPLDEFVVLGSRGCPHNCTYCCNHVLKRNFPWLNKVRHYSVEYLVGNLKEALRYYPAARSFWIGDDTFFAKDLDEIIKFCQRYKNEIARPFLILISPWTFDENKMEPLLDAGMTKLIMGIQSGSENVTSNIYRRNLSKENIFQIVKTLHKYTSRALICYDFIGMNPFETQKDLLDTMRFIRNMPPPFWLYSNNLAFYPKTDLYLKAVNSGLDTHLRIKHSEASVGYLILKQEKLKHKLLHLMLLLMAGYANEKRIGSVRRFFISDRFIDFYRFLDNKSALLTNILAIVIIHVISFYRLTSVKAAIRNIVGVRRYASLKGKYIKLFRKKETDLPV